MSDSQEKRARAWLVGGGVPQFIFFLVTLRFAWGMATRAGESTSGLDLGAGFAAVISFVAFPVAFTMLVALVMSRLRPRGLRFLGYFLLVAFFAVFALAAMVSVPGASAPDKAIPNSWSEFLILAFGALASLCALVTGVVGWRLKAPGPSTTA